MLTLSRAVLHEDCWLICCSPRRNPEAWFERHGVQPLVVAEFEDRALMKAFGERGSGVFTSPTAVEQDVLDQLGIFE